MIIINAHVFQCQQEDLTMLSGALNHIEAQVYQFLDILDELPPDLKEQLQESLNNRVTGVGCVCKCLSTLTGKMSGDSSDWAFWARQTGTEITYKPVPGGAL